MNLIFQKSSTDQQGLWYEDYPPPDWFLALNNSTRVVLYIWSNPSNNSQIRRYRFYWPLSFELRKKCFSAMNFNVLFTLNQTTFKCLYEHLNKKIKYRDLIYFILKLLEWWICTMYEVRICQEIYDRVTMTVYVKGKVIYTKYSKQFKWNSYFYVSVQSRPFLGSTKNALKFIYEI